MLLLMRAMGKIIPVVVVVIVALYAATDWRPGFDEDSSIGAGVGERSSSTFPAELVRVLDGDSLIVRDARGGEVEIRIHGIDAPERRQPYSNASRRALSERLSEAELVVEPYTRDRYDRVVAKLTVDGRDLGLEQIEAGLAWHYKQYAEEQSRKDRQLYAAAEDRARTGRLGLWADREPVPPWEFRQSLRRQ